MAERIWLDPSEVATASRTQLDISGWIDEAGPDWGDAEIQTYMADQSRGATPVDFRVPNRTVSIPLNLKTLGGTSFATVRSLVQAKAALMQREGGWLKRRTAAGGTVFADVVNATVRLGGGWSQAHKDFDLDAVLTLECSPDFYEAERTLSDHTETSACELVFTETDVDGDYPARVRVVVDEDDGDAQLGLIWSFRNRHYSSAATAATRFEAEALNPLDGAAKVALSGASGGTVVTHGTLGTNWTPVLDMRAAGTAYPTHTGTNRLWVRYRTTSGTAVQLRAVYDVGDLILPVENPPIRCNAGTQFFVADLGEARLDPAPVGTHRWQAIFQAKGEVGTENVSIDKVWVVNADEGYGVLRASTVSDTGLVTYTGRSNFTTESGAITGDSALVGGVWAGAGDADDFSVAAGVATRTAVSDTAETGRSVTLNLNHTATAVQVDAKSSANPNPAVTSVHGVLARWSAATTYVRASWAAVAGGKVNAQFLIRNAGASVETQEVPTGLVYADSTYFTTRLIIYTNGTYAVWVYAQGGVPGDPIITGQNALLATGGALAAGDPGMYDERTSGSADTRTYDNFNAWVPLAEAVLNASQSAELRWDGMAREDSAGNAYGPVSNVVGDLPRLPPTVEGRTTEVFIKASRGDFAGLPDTGIDDISARITYRPCWLTVPGA